MFESWRLPIKTCPDWFLRASSGRMQIESKADMRKRGVASPDRADAVCLTFYQKPAMRGGSKFKGYVPPTNPRGTWMGV